MLNLSCVSFALHKSCAAKAQWCTWPAMASRLPSRAYMCVLTPSPHHQQVAWKWRLPRGEGEGISTISYKCEMLGRYIYIISKHTNIFCLTLWHKNLEIRIATDIAQSSATNTSSNVALLTWGNSLQSTRSIKWYNYVALINVYTCLL